MDQNDITYMTPNQEGREYRLITMAIGDPGVILPSQ